MFWLLSVRFPMAFLARYGVYGFSSFSLMDGAKGIVYFAATRSAYA